MNLSSRTQAILWGLLSALSFTCLTAVVKFTTTQVAIPLLILSRNLLGCLFMIPFIWKKKLKKPSKKQVPFYLLRALIGTLTIFLTYYVYNQLPLHIATSIGYIEPIIQVVVSLLFFKAHFSRHEGISILLSIVGVAIITYNAQGEDSFFINKIVWLDLFNNLLATIAKGMTKRLTSTEPPHQIMWYGYLLNSLVILIYLLFDHSLSFSVFKTFPPHIFLLFLLGAFLSSISNYAYTKGLSLTDMHVLSPISYTKLLFSIPIGFFLYHEIPTSMTLLGSTILISGNYFLLFSGKRLKKKK